MSDFNMELMKRKLELNKEEEWKTVEEFKEYQVSSLGRVRKWFRGNWRYVTLPKASKGASRKVTFIEDGVTYGRMLGKLVYETFIGVETNQNIVYLDGNKENCSLINLATVDELIKCYEDKMNCVLQSYDK